MKFLYKYPQAAFPYAQLVEENRRRGKRDLEYELLDTGVFDDNRYFDVFVEYAKAGPDDILIRIKAINRGPERPTCTCCRRSGSATPGPGGCDERTPAITARRRRRTSRPSSCDHYYYGARWLYCEGTRVAVHRKRNQPASLYGADNASPYVKDGINDYIVHGEARRSTPSRPAPKPRRIISLTVAAGRDARRSACGFDRPAASPRAAVSRRRLRSALRPAATRSGRILRHGHSARISPTDRASVMRQAFAGLLWSKQFYHYVVNRWLRAIRPVRRRRASAAVAATTNGGICTTTMSSRCPTNGNIPGTPPGTWPSTASPLALVDPDFAKEQLMLMLREWYMHPNGQMPAYEWAFGDVNPPVHAWAAWRVYKIEQKRRGDGDRDFLERVFHKLLLNFTWWVNRKDAEGTQRLSGRLPRPGQHRRLRSQRAAAHRRLHRAVRRHQLDGHVLPEHAGHRAGTGQRKPGL